MKSPLVSILIPFKNTAVFLPECFESILGQNYTNWEVIAVDDHSEDKSLHIAQTFENKDKRIQIVSNSGKGIIEALRTAYSLANGIFITRMDSDDVMINTRLETMVKSLLEHGAGHVSVGQVRYFSSRGISNGYERYEHWLNGLTAAGTNYDEIYKECVIPSPCWMVHKKDFETVEAFKPNRYPEDYDLAFRFYENGLKVIPCDEVLLLWRDYDTRTSRTSEHYAHNYFLDIKLYYFLKLHYDKTKYLVVWGAGSKGKTVTKMLIQNKIDFKWICDNAKKIGKDIYGKKMLAFQTLDNLDNFQSIITVANENEQAIIKNYLSKLGKRSMKDYFFFC